MATQVTVQRVMAVAARPGELRYGRSRRGMVRRSLLGMATKAELGFVEAVLSDEARLVQERRDVLSRFGQS